jgi:transposase
VKRLTDRLARCMDGLLTFLDHPEVSATNNRAEREIRPAVIIRKRSLQNRSQKGAQCQAVFMSIYRTLKLRGLDPIGTMVTALKEYVRTGSLPPLPAPGARDPP